MKKHKLIINKGIFQHSFDFFSYMWRVLYVGVVDSDRLTDPDLRTPGLHAEAVLYAFLASFILITQLSILSIVFFAINARILYLQILDAPGPGLVFAALAMFFGIPTFIFFHPLTFLAYPFVSIAMLIHLGTDGVLSSKLKYLESLKVGLIVLSGFLHWFLV